jgi:hypothetical protein
MRYAALFIATCAAVAATLVMAIHLTTGPVAAQGCKGPPRCLLGSVAVCTKRCGHHSCREWTCARRVSKPPMTKEPFGGPRPLPWKPLPRSQLR